MRYRKLERKPSALARRRFRMAIARLVGVVVLVVACVGGVAALSHLSRTTIQTVHVYGAASVSDTDIVSTVQEMLTGSYPLFFSRSNILLYPAASLHRSLLDRFPRIDSVDIARENLTTISVAVKERAPYAIWCGENALPDDETTGACYFLDDGGFIFMKAPDFTGPVYFRYFGALPSGDPIGQRFLPEETFRNLSYFFDEMRDASHRTPVSLAVIDGVDIDIHFAEGGRVMFELFQDLDTVLKNAKAVFDSDILKKKGASLEYVDLRFGNRAYYKFNDE